LAKPPFFILRQSPVGKTVHIVVAHFDVRIDGSAVYGFDLSFFNSNDYFRHINFIFGVVTEPFGMRRRGVKDEKSVVRG